MFVTRHSRGALLIALAGLACCGCATAPYSYGTAWCKHPDPAIADRVVIERGGPNKRLDRLARVFDAPCRYLSPRHWVPRRPLSPETETQLTAYMAHNDLTEVPVFVNHYDPRGQWRRLRENKRVAAGWRYSLGTLSMLGYTLFPGRVFGTDHYNPYTDCLYVNSDTPSAVLHEAAMAKDIHARWLPGSYAAMTSLPGIAMVREGRAVGDILGYAQAEEIWPIERDAYRLLYPRVGAESMVFALPLAPLWWEGPVLGLAGGMAGRGVGYVAEKRRRNYLEKNDPELLVETKPLPPAVRNAEVVTASYEEVEPLLLERLPPP